MCSKKLASASYLISDRQFLQLHRRRPTPTPPSLACTLVDPSSTIINIFQDWYEAESAVHSSIVPFSSACLPELCVPLVVVALSTPRKHCSAHRRGAASCNTNPAGSPAIMSQPKTSSKSKSSKSDSSKVHKLALKGSSKVVNEFVSGVAPACLPICGQTLRPSSLNTRSTPYCRF